MVDTVSAGSSIQCSSMVDTVSAGSRIQCVVPWLILCQLVHVLWTWLPSQHGICFLFLFFVLLLVM